MSDDLKQVAFYIKKPTFNALTELAQQYPFAKMSAICRGIIEEKLRDEGLLPASQLTSNKPIAAE
jgi:hypothetical protein